MLDIFDMPETARPYLGTLYPIGIELNVHEVFRKFPQDFGPSVFANFIGTGQSNDKIYAIRGLEAPINPCRLVVTHVESDFKKKQCYLYCADTPENRKALMTLKLTYG